MTNAFYSLNTGLRLMEIKKADQITEIAKTLRIVERRKMNSSNYGTVLD